MSLYDQVITSLLVSGLVMQPMFWWVIQDHRARKGHRAPQADHAVDHARDQWT